MASGWMGGWEVQGQGQVNAASVAGTSGCLTFFPPLPFPSHPSFIDWLRPSNEAVRVPSPMHGFSGGKIWDLFIPNEQNIRKAISGVDSKTVSSIPGADIGIDIGIGSGIGVDVDVGIDAG
ncbi:hypothetical protein KEM56_002533, partial [Ascosphaera pollenicola]